MLPVSVVIATALVAINVQASTVILNSCGQKLTEFKLEPGEGPFSDEDVDEILFRYFGEDVELAPPEELFNHMMDYLRKMDKVYSLITIYEQNARANATNLDHLYGLHHDLGNILVALKRRYAKADRSLEN